ncbi:AraC family transcriptional regulator ligand-binding domain-containing protein [Pseudomonas sp. LRF_L74]|uniref:AraC family transcriptional regulator ligand-binding domain-containing protein n=1 Tax=Pseudomonas sp. LRF_L74 TaxID=3369422 RepID=UPI003F602BC6
MLHSRLTTLHCVSLILQTLDGHDPDALLAGSGISRDDLKRPDCRITTAQEMHVCANAVAVHHDLGLELGRRMHVSSYGVLGYTLLSSATLGDALCLALEYPALLGTFFELSLQREGDVAWLQAVGYRDLPELTVFNTEFCLASLKLICDDLIGRPLPLIGARFQYPRPAYEAQYDYSFACERQFGAMTNAIGFEARLLDQPLPLADPVTHLDMRAQCRQQNIEFVSRQALITRVRQLLSAQLPEAPSLEALARQMHCSPRTLRRHLHEAGSGYQALLDELRFARARQLLEQERLPVYRVAEAMGYSETASFRHAFQRWSGMSPRRFRA